MKILALAAGLLLAIELRHESFHAPGRFPEPLLLPSTEPGQESLGLEAGLGFMVPGLSLRGGARWRFQAEDMALSVALRYDLLRERR